MPRPPSSGSVTSQFGMRYHPITGVYRMHYGQDTIGDGNYAPVSGTVVWARWDSTGMGFGNAVGIRLSSDDTVICWVAHHSSLSVREGEFVTEGATRLGPMGMTGAATGKHAHTEFRVGGSARPGSGTALDPRVFYALGPSGGSGGGGLQKRKNDMSALHFKTGDSAQPLGWNYYILVLETGALVPYTTGNQAFVDGITAAIGSPTTTDAALMRSLQNSIKSQAPKVVIDASGIKVTVDNADTVAALTKLGVDLKQFITVDAPKVNDEYRDGKKQS